MATATASQFGPEFPPNCPPPSATSANATVYRLVRRQPPDATDFQTHAELDLAPRADPCDRCGLSVYADPNDAVAKYQEVVNRYGPEGTKIGRLVARLLLTPIHGQFLATPNQRVHDSHHTWWPYCGADRLSSFDQIVEDASNALGT